MDKLRHVTVKRRSPLWVVEKIPADAALGRTEYAVIHGDPNKAGPFIIRLKSPPNSILGVHWHKFDENITVLSGVWCVGQTDKIDLANCKDMPAGSFLLFHGACTIWRSRRAASWNCTEAAPSEPTWCHNAAHFGWRVLASIKTDTVGGIAGFMGRTQTVSLIDGTRYLNALPLVPQSETRFDSTGAAAEFTIGANGAVTHLILSQTEGDATYDRKP